MNKIVLGILAHVDSGKTTLSEGILYTVGEIRKLGRVDHKNAFLDTHELERERGITIFSKQALLNLDNTSITLLDTPGHVDFSAETERTLQVLDYAVLVVSGAEGVQSHTQTLWRLLERYNIPVFIYVNKMDISQLAKQELLYEIQQKLGGVDFSEEYDEKFFEELAMCDEGIMEEFLKTGTVSDDLICEAVQRRKVFPCYFGSALKLDGIDKLLKGLDRFTVSKQKGNEFGAKVFKITEDDRGNRLTHMKITSGVLKVKSLIKTGDTEEKVNQIRIYSGTKFEAVNEVETGDVCAVTGILNSFPGQGLGIEKGSMKPFMEPVLSYKIDILDGTDVQTALKKLKQLEQEDPELNIVWNEQLKEIHAKIMGEIQIEILKRIVSERFGMKIEFTHGGIAYKETIASPVEGVGHFEPLRHYAEVHLLLQPGEAGSGVQIFTDCSEDKLSRNWQRLIVTHLYEKNHLGVLTGSPVTDIKITLIAGRAHLKHTEGGDFRQATYRAVRQGLMMAESVLLEPWYSFRIELPCENVGRAMTDLENMGAVIKPPEQEGDISIVCGNAPVSKMRTYHTELNSYTKGQGKLFFGMDGYRPCHNADEVIKSIAYDPESDIENTPDSVFCAHGAGFNVKWDEVRNYMHITTDTQKEETNEAVSRYIQSIAADDNELMQIFERTYGPIKRFKEQPQKHYQQQVKKHTPKKQIIQGDEYLLVDGYNIIFAWDELKNLAAENLDLARNRLINILCNYQGVKQCKLILVFDAYKVKGNEREVEKIHNISVVYTKEAETADMYIEKVTHELGKKNRVRVATSDGVEQIIILAGGALRVSAEAFYEEIKITEKAIADFLKNQR